MTVGELVYSILDLAKISGSDDSYITEDHVIFLCKKYRAFLIKKEQEKEKSSTDVASEFEYQQICLDLEKISALDGVPCADYTYLRTTQKIPKILEGTQPRVYPFDYYQGANVTFVPRDRMRYVGTNPYTKNFIYTSLGPDQYLYMKSNNIQFRYLKKLKMSAVFEDFDSAAELLCDEEGSSVACDVLDAEFPIREYLVPSLIELVVKELVGVKYQKVDTKNDASDNLSDVNVKA
jgi:hypothetical protein